MVEYQVFEARCAAPELGAYTAYGIRAVETSGARAVLAALADVFCRRDLAARLCALLNRLRLDPIHLPDVIDDALAGAF